jgi:hypothetical protein
VAWELATPQGIQVGRAWNSGRVNALLVLGGGDLLIGTDGAGVWHRQASADIVPCSHGWDTPDIGCLARGSRGPHHAYAGCLDGRWGGAPAALWETGRRWPTLDWHRVPLTDAHGRPVPTGGIFAIAAVPAQDAIVLACAGGVYWSGVPAAGGAYAFQAAAGVSGAFTGVALGPAGRVAVSAWRGKADPHGSAIFYGDWPGGVLAFTRAHVHGTKNVKQTTRIGLAGCLSKPERMYALAVAKDDMLHAVYRSNDGGANWTNCPTAVEGSTDHIDDRPLPGSSEHTPSHQGASTCAIGASAVDHRVLAFGLTEGPYVSVNGGRSWRRHVPDAEPGLHVDMHAVYFDPEDLSGQRLLIGSDGGVAVTLNLGKSWVSTMNARLPTLQCARGMPSLSSSPTEPGLIAGGHQDNGNLFTVIDGTPRAWRQLEGGDGDVDQFLADGRLLRRNNTLPRHGHEFGAYVRVATWNGGNGAFDDSEVIPVDGVSLPKGLIAQLVALTVANGAWPTEGRAVEPIRAVACKWNTNLLFLLLDPGHLHWCGVGSLGPGVAGSVSAVASYDGTRIRVGTDHGEVFDYDALNKVRQRVTVHLPGGRPRAGISHLAVMDDGTWVGLMATKNPDTVIVASPGATSFHAATDPEAAAELTALHVRGNEIWLGSDSHVYRSVDRAATWADMSDGLPARPHCSRLTDMRDGAGRDFVLLSTYGRSVWRLAV